VGTTVSLYGVAFGGKSFVAVGETGYILISQDGISWASPAPVTFKSFNAVAYGGGLFVTVGVDGAVATSSDGADWTLQDINSIPFEDFVTLAFGSNTFVAVTDRGAIYSSTDGETWRFERLTAEGSSVAFGNGVFALPSPANGVEGVFTSTDGSQWSHHPTEDSLRFSNIAFASGKFFGAGDKLAVSDNGESWTLVGPQTRDALNAVAYGGNTFVAVGYQGTVLTSKDVVRWTKGSSGTETLHRIAFGADKFVAVGKDRGPIRMALRLGLKLSCPTACGEAGEAPC
jgi:hypothetical protein